MKKRLSRFSVLAFAQKRQLARLLWIWGSMGLLSLILLTLVYTLFFGYNKVTRNAGIYEHYLHVGLPGAAQLATQEGYGLTTYGEDALIVNKALRDDVFRIMFIGDSFVKAKQVSDSLKFTELIESQWNHQHPDQPIQVLNLGLGGQDMATYLRFGANMDRRFQPDLVFLVLSPDDFKALSRRSRILTQLKAGITPQLVKREQSSLVQDVVNQIGIRSFVGQLQAQTFAFMSNGDAADVVDAADNAAPRNAQDALEAASIQLTALHNIWGERMVIVYRRNIPDLGKDAPPQIDDSVLRAIKRQGIPLINLYPPLWQAYQEKRPPAGFHNTVIGQGHLNANGHQLVADEIIWYLENHRDLF